MSGFVSMPQRLVGERRHRAELATNALQYHQTFFDDYLKALLPNDLVCITAPTGIGKTDLALSIAAANARLSVPVHYFALEAAERELERRTKYSILARLVYRARHPQAYLLNYDDWFLGRCDEICDEFEAEAEAAMQRTLATLHTYYRGSKFDPEDLARGIFEVAKSTRLIIVDHLHYVDNDDDDEHRALGDTVKVVRDVSLRIGRPVILVAHLRKRDRRSRQLFVEVEDISGSKHVVNICTQVLSLQPALDLESPKWFLAPTYLQVLKHRGSGALRMVAVAMFDRRTRAYEPYYSLGTTKGGTKWEPLKELEQAPPWARHHRPWSDDGPRTQEQLPDVE